MPNLVIIGAQWGDEGKGKIIDVLTEEVDWVVRYQGGNNAGHTVEIGQDRYVLHLVPSGILHPDKKCVIGNGVVVDPLALVRELQELEQHGIRPQGQLFISDRAHIVFPYHRLADEKRESRAFEEKIGTTKRGIGPSYSDKATRVGLRMGDLLDKNYAERLRVRLAEQNVMLAALGVEGPDEKTVLTQYQEAARILSPMIADTILLLNRALARGESVLFEGAQGTMLDIDFGTYPFVTSSNTTAGGACTGAGVAPYRIDQVIGVIKAYTTRVGEGPFPTELKDDAGRRLQELGHEFGATTGRPRRCGWFDAVVARYSAMINGIDYWALTKMDVLDQMETIRICTAYEVDGKVLDSVPANVRILEKCTPVCEDFSGWRTSTQGISRFEDLPARAKAYVKKVEALTGVPVGILSVGPRRDSTMRLPISLNGTRRKS